MEENIQEALTKGVDLHISGEFELAGQLYRSVIELQPEHADANHNMGLLKIDTGNDLEALPYLQTALQADMSIAQFWLSYIQLLIKLERVEEASRILNLAKESGIEGEEFGDLSRKLIEINKVGASNNLVEEETYPAKPNILDELKLDKALQLAKKKLKAGSSEEASLIYQDILEKFPKNKRAINGLRALEDERATEASVALDPSQLQLQSLVNLYGQGKFQQALDQANALLQQFPNSSALYNISGAVYKGFGQLDASIAAYNKAIAIKPDFAEAFGNLGVTLKEQGKLNEAIEAYKKALAIKPEYAEAYNNMGVALQDQGKFEEATEAYKKALSVKPDFAKANYNMGNALKQQGKTEVSIAAYNRAIASRPDYADAYNNMGNVLKEHGNLKEAIEAYKKAIGINPDNAHTHNNLGAALQDQGKFEEAIEAYKKALSIEPDFAEAASNMGSCLIKTGKFEEGRSMQKADGAISL